MSATVSRIATAPWDCPWCGEQVPEGHIIAAVNMNSTSSLGCIACAWAAINNDLHTTKPPDSEETRG